MYPDHEALSPEAKRLVELTCPSGRPDESVDVQQVLAEHPELMSGLNEYIQWRERNASAVEQKPAAKGTAHPMATAIRKAGGKAGK